ncbi:hypothetical protein SDRG_03453 [Saprolegnia diclina VS20]|uniref:HSF-type DNA-binding domain-containing protein n=1 Tax=Saprolegnia diclina (strain VS20) TaxID=1156394 RepID=T0S2N1_SAPDV|nr:hypothetical protein SDRG_03453 [Saprolegnia diclina VS20]EQC39248.1 hypothetical protein SDRG_03453 [Saprolegnia diclina VS20]|eukprot:XP_008607309.1 hypothetical protein SDRG_03453 [Saprolegnia diclina VS20]
MNSHMYQSQHYHLGAGYSPRTDAMLSSAVAPFLATLYEILTKERPSTISWCHDGKAFVVYDYDAMESHILPTYFRHNKFASFQRQLNYFGFRKLHKAKENDYSSVYCQPNFIRDDPNRMLLIKRKTHRPKATTPRNGVDNVIAIPILVRSRSASEPPAATTSAPALSRSHSAPASTPAFNFSCPGDADFVPMSYGRPQNLPPAEDFETKVALEFAAMQMYSWHSNTLPSPCDVESVLQPIPFDAKKGDESFEFSPEDLDLISAFDPFVAIL